MIGNEENKKACFCNKKRKEKEAISREGMRHKRLNKDYYICVLAEKA